MPARHVYLSACFARHVYLSACSALCPLGTALPREVLQDVRPTYGSLTGKKQGGHFHGVEPHAHVKPCEKPCKLFHVQKNKLFHMSCHAKNRMQNRAKKQAVPHVMQKPCKNHAKCGAYGVPTRRTLTVPRLLAICAICAIWFSQGKPLNIHSPPGPCYMYYMCYMGLTRQATEHPLSPGPLLYVLYVLYGPL